LKNRTPRSPSAHAPLNRGARGATFTTSLLRGLLLLSLLPLLALAADIPPLKARVTDLTGTLDAQQTSALEQTLAEFEKRKGTQIAVLMVPTTQPETIEEYAVRVEEAWKLGRKGVDDSALLVIAKNDRRLRIEVGYGLEGALPDAIAKRIIDNDITPRFKQGDFYGGIRAGVDRIIRVVEGEKLPPPAAHGPASGFSPDLLIFLFFFVLVAGGVLRAIFGRVLGAGFAGGVAGFAGWMLLGSLAVALGIGVLAFLFLLLTGGFGGVPRRRGWSSRGPWVGGGWGGGGFGGGGFGGGGFSGGGFSGGGGSSGGGGASGSW
jgi:uncharacterized protein